MIKENQWVLGWNAGRYDKQKTVEEVRSKPVPWRLGYIVGMRERKLQTKESNQRIKRIMTFGKVSLSLD